MVRGQASTRRSFKELGMTCSREEVDSEIAEEALAHIYDIIFNKS